MSQRKREEEKKDRWKSLCNFLAEEPKEALVNAVKRALIWPATEHVLEACCSAHRVYSGERRVAGGTVHCAYSCPIFRQHTANPDTPSSSPL